MPLSAVEILKQRVTPAHLERLSAIDNAELFAFVADAVELLDPESVYVVTDSPEDLKTVREQALADGEEFPLPIAGHTYHFDSILDQARDKENTRILVPEGEDLGPHFNTMERLKGTAEVRGILSGAMKGRVMWVRFFCLGPVRSPFTVLACQVTDSTYVAHNLDLLYRQGYEEFKRQGQKARFFKVVHSQGELENGVSKNIPLRRVYVDPVGRTVYSSNTQYGGNTLGLKKLSMRLAIHQASSEGWLCEHMFVMAVHGPAGRKTYFTGAFPSLCGKTSTSMMRGETIVGDDIAYLRNLDGKLRAVNVEKGMFGIIMGVNSKDDPILWKTLHAPNEIIFSNVLVTPGKTVYWIGKDGPVPPSGINHSGEWAPGKKDAKGREIDPSHKNGRFTLSLNCLENVDPELDNPEGVAVGGVIYGARDSSAWVPVRQAFDWVHGIATIAASLESETTAATLSKEGVVNFDPMSNLDFVSIPLGRYIRNNLDMGRNLRQAPPVFGVNYFLRGEDGRWLNEKTDKAVWLKWMERRAHGEAGAIRTPVGFIPEYTDLEEIFRTLQGKAYSPEAYTEQFTIRVDQYLAKMERIEKIYRTEVRDTPPELFDVIGEEIRRLREAKEKHGPRIAPDRF
ncbi:phosphoenolpyruvate carboxykinase (GTP) [bacterium]|nr:phosphoenolpyruvate carboxykinase (GTP) [bacterium]